VTPAPPKPKPGTLEILTVTTGGRRIPARVFVDGETAPRRGRVRLAPGRHRIRIEATGFAPMEREVEIASGASERLPVVVDL
jgi:hypothetical protein